MFFINEILYGVMLGCPKDTAEFEGEVGWASKEI